MYFETDGVLNNVALFYNSSFGPLRLQSLIFTSNLTFHEFA